MKNISKEKISFQLRTIVVVKYLEIYNYMEEKVKNIFSEEIKNTDEKFKNKLYFLYGGNSSINIDFSKNMLIMNAKKFRENEEFNSFSFNQIIKICKEDKKIEKFNFNIKSIQVKQEEFDFYSLCTKLISMRNKLAHEILKDNFDDEDIIELLSDEKIKENVILELETFDINLMDLPTKQIYSNLLYLNRIVIEINEDKSLLEFK